MKKCGTSISPCHLATSIALSSKCLVFLQRSSSADMAIHLIKLGVLSVTFWYALLKKNIGIQKKFQIKSNLQPASLNRWCESRIDFRGLYARMLAMGKNPFAAFFDPSLNLKFNKNLTDFGHQGVQL